MKTISIRINYETRVKRKFEKFLDMYGKELKRELNELSIVRYHKFDNQFQATFNIIISESEQEKIVFEILQMANLLSDSGSLNWKFNGPRNIQNELMFECFLNNQEDDQPIKWVHIEVDNQNTVT